MKPRWSIVVLIAVLSLILGTRPVRADKSYSIAKVDIQARLAQDGSLSISELRTYRFEGSFRYAFRYLPTSGPVSFTDFSITENNTPFSLSDSEQPNTYRVTENGHQTEIRWFFRASDEERTFGFHYRVVDLVQRFEDTAVLYYQFLSSDWDRSSEYVRLVLSPPEPLSKDRVQAWLHGPLWAEYRIEQDGSITAWSDKIPRHTIFEVRALYPPEVFPGADRKPEFVAESIRAQEAEWAEEANIQRQRAIEKENTKAQRWGYGKWAAIAAGLVGFLNWFRLYSRYGKRPAVLVTVQIVASVPSETPPALVGYLLSGKQVYGNALTSTLFDLARQGILTLKDERAAKTPKFSFIKDKSKYSLELNRSEWKKKQSGLRPFENDLVGYLFDDLAGGENTITMKTIQKKQYAFMKFFNKWKKSVSQEGKAKNWFDKDSDRGMVWSLLTAAALLVLSILIGIFFGPWALLAGGVTLVVFVLSFAIPHRTVEGQNLAVQWKAFKKYLQRFRANSPEASMAPDFVTDALVYGVALGLMPKNFKELAMVVPPDQAGHFLPWYTIQGGRGASFTPESFASAFSNMVSIASSTMSSASGTGGGASGGGGGGAGSGGGGAG